jgi:hypothetical protein
MVGKTMKMLVAVLIAAFALSTMAEAAPKKTRHRAKHSSRVASGAAATSGKAPAAKKKAPAARSRTRAHAKSAQKPGLKKAPAKRRPTTKPR